MSIDGIVNNPYIYTGLKAGLNAQKAVRQTSPFEVAKDEFVLTSNPANAGLQSSELKEQLEETKKEQGFIGKIWDGFKNLTGIGAGSNKAEKAIEQFEKGEISEEEAQKAIEAYKAGQKQCVDMAADVVSGIVSFAAFSMATAAGIAAAPFTGGVSLGLVAAGFGIAGAAGAASKVAIKGLDAATGGREYSGKDIIYDVATGGINGIFAPITAGIGGAAGKAVGRAVGVQGIREGGEILVREGLENTMRGAFTRTFLSTSVKYTGGTAASRALCLATDMAVNGAISGAVDSSTRYVVGDEENKSLSGLLQNAGQGALSGFVMAPVIGGGMRLAGNGINKITNNINRGMTFERVMPDGINTTFKQGTVGDCHLVSMLDSMLNNPKASKLIKKAILTTSDGNYQVKIGNELVTVAKNSIPEGILADNQGIRIFEQAYRQLNGGNLDGGFADAVSKQFGLSPVHIAQSDLTDEVIEKLSKEQTDLVLSAGIEKEGQRHYLSVRNIDTEKGIVTLVDPSDTSNVIQTTLADFRKQLISLDGGSLEKTDLPISARSANEAVFKGKVAGFDEDMIRHYGFTADEVLAAEGLIEGEKTFITGHFMRQNSYFDSSNLTLLDSISIMDAIQTELCEPKKVPYYEFLTDAERKMFAGDELKAQVLGEFRRKRANEIKLSIDNEIVTAMQSPEVLIKIGDVNGSEKSVYCLDQKLKNTPPNKNVSASFSKDLAKGGMITSECLDAYERFSGDADFNAILKRTKISYSENQYSKIKIKSTAFDLVQKARTEGLASLTSTEKHKLDEIFSDIISGGLNPEKGLDLRKVFLKELKIDSDKYGKIQGLVDAMKEVLNKNGISAESDHFYMRVIDRDLLGTFDTDGKFYDFQSMIRKIKQELVKHSSTLKNGEGEFVISEFNNLGIKYRYDSNSGNIQLVTIYNVTPEL